MKQSFTLYIEQTSKGATMNAIKFSDKKTSQHLSDAEPQESICDCGGEVVNHLVGDETYQKCVDCGKVYR